MGEGTLSELWRAETGEAWDGPTLASVARQRADLEGLGAAREAEREGEGQRSSRRRPEGELLQEGCEEDEELGPGELLPGTSPLAWKRSKNQPTESPASISHPSGSSRTHLLAQAAGAFLP